MEDGVEVARPTAAALGTSPTLRLGRSSVVDGLLGDSSSASGLKCLGPVMVACGVATAGPDPPRLSPPDLQDLVGGVGFFCLMLWPPYRSLRLA